MKLKDLLTKEQKEKLVGTNKLALCTIEMRHGRPVIKQLLTPIETLKILKSKDVKDVKPKEVKE